jgi:hypothetical protein
LWVTQANLVEATAMAAEEAEVARRRPASAVRRASLQVAASALSFNEQLTVVYAGVTAAYAAYAARVFADVAAGRHPTVVDGGSPQPSHLITDVDRFTPLLQIPEPPPRDLPAQIVAEQNAELGEVYAHLVEIIEQRLGRDSAASYDDPASVARRPAGAMDLVVEFPAALHRYAASATWAVGIMAASSADESAQV